MVEPLWGIEPQSKGYKAFILPIELKRHTNISLYLIILKVYHYRNPKQIPCAIGLRLLLEMFGFFCLTLP